MFSLFRMEAVARDATISHFLLMFGYKLFSFFFPLFLLQKGFSLPEVGYTYLLIYLPLALFAPFVGVLNHRFNPALLASLGILGYGLYSLAMMYAENIVVFFLSQALLGIAGALFFASLRAVLMGSQLQNPEKSFAWFYSAPFYVEAIAPALGAFLIWQGGFFWVFALSFAIHLFNGGFTLFRLSPHERFLKDHDALSAIGSRYRSIVAGFAKNKILPFFFLSFAVLLIGGFYRAFFVLFLKDIGWTQNVILLYGTIFSILFVPLSLLFIHELTKREPFLSMLKGGVLCAAMTMFFGAFGAFLGFAGVLLTMLLRAGGALMVNADRSGLLMRAFSHYPEEMGALDTVFSPLGVALGALGGGLLVGLFGYPALFFWAGIFILGVVTWALFVYLYCK